MFAGVIHRKREVQKEVGEDSHAEAAPGAATLSGDLVSGG